MAQGAAFFDLDRTLLSGASGPVLSEAMRDAGVVSRKLPGERLLYGLFNRVGENLPSIGLARQAVRFVRGRAQSAMRDAGRQAGPVLAAAVQPYAPRLFDEHRAAGRPIVLATTTPYDLIAPFAEALGIDDVIATRYGVDAEGNYNGSIDGPFVWAAGKLSAVRDWAVRHDVDLSESWAYSDSVFDSPLLSAVGHPVAVNPDPRLLALSILRRWPVLHLDVAPGVLKLPVLGLEVQDLARVFARPELIPYARFDIEGTERIPVVGPAILVANHRSYFDAVAVALVIARSGRTARFLGKKEVFDAPVVGALVKAVGGIRVERASGSDEPLRAAADALAAGELVCLMPEGTIPRGRAFFDPVLKGRWGAARLATMSKAPVVPVGLWGTEQVWPRSSRVPNVLNLTSPPTIRVRVGDPVDLKYRSTAKDTERIMTAISALLPPESRVRREPTPDELARSFPPGYKGDPDAEPARRPGQD